MYKPTKVPWKLKYGVRRSHGWIRLTWNHPDHLRSKLQSSWRKPCQSEGSQSPPSSSKHFWEHQSHTTVWDIFPRLIHGWNLPDVGAQFAQLPEYQQPPEFYLSTIHFNVRNQDIPEGRLLDSCNSSLDIWRRICLGNTHWGCQRTLPPPQVSSHWSACWKRSDDQDTECTCILKANFWLG